MVTSVESATEAAVSWIPPAGALGEDVEFNIYGVTGGILQPLGSVAYPSTAFTAPSGYLAYAVTTVHDGAESEPTRSCVSSRLDPPPPIVAYDPDCGLGKYTASAAAKRTV